MTNPNINRLTSSVTLVASLLGAAACSNHSNLIQHHNLHGIVYHSKHPKYTKRDLSVSIVRALHSSPDQRSCTALQPIGAGDVADNLKRIFPQMAATSEIQTEATSQSAAAIEKLHPQPKMEVEACAVNLVSPSGIPEGLATLAYLIDDN